MARKRRSNRWYDDEYFPRSTPRKAEGGIEAKTKRGAFGQSWWAKRWIAVLEAYGLGTRLQRGRSYARGGQVLNVEVEPGHVTAQVQGSRPRPYDIDIRLPVLSDAEWERAIDAMSAQALFAAKLLAGEMPQDIEDAFKAANVFLFPTRSSDLRTDCSCPDFANPCKHIAAVYYLLGEQFDADPFVLFTLRGRRREQVIEALRQRRATAIEADAPSGDELQTEAPAPALSETIDTFWQLGDLSALAIHVAAPDMEAVILRRLGAAPGNTDEALRQVYRALTDIVLQKIAGE
ncbi:MAG: SWIM zinc finger family protein [Aggregatilineales bacterium]